MVLKFYKGNCIFAMALLFLVCLVTNAVNAYILRLPCLTYANFSIVRPDHALSEDVLETYNDLSEDECENKCEMHPSCKSINTRNSTGENCQLIGKSTEDPFDNVKLSGISGWKYKTTDHKTRNIGHFCQEKRSCPIGSTCIDTCTCPGYECQITQTILEDPLYNCQQAYNKGHTSTSVLPIYIPGLDFCDVRCDMVTNGGGWIVFQRRVDGSVDFYRGWDEYKNGFGDLNGNFWLGLEKLHKLTSQGKRAILRVDLKHYIAPNTIRYAVYNGFEIGSESEGYMLKIGTYSGNAGNSLASHNNRKFTTKDRDNDLNSLLNCAQRHNGSWWYARCHFSNLNALFPIDGLPNTNCMSWRTLHNRYGGVMFSEMKMQYSNP